MFWIIQENFSNEIGFDRLIDSLRRHSLPFIIVKVIPFVHELLPEPNIPNLPIIISGSKILSKIALDRGWQPGALLNENFDFCMWREKYRGLLLNDDAIVTEFGKLAPIEPVFVRPCSDCKTFGGFMLEPENLQSWREQILGISDGHSTLTADTLVLSATVKEILQEYRFFVVDGRVITGSQYKVSVDLHANSHCDRSALALAETAARIWQPASAFVIDIAITPIGAKVIEINCLTTSGFYGADVDLLVEALEQKFACFR
jgi:ATP-grasp domain, R2K clade family 3